MTTPPSARAHQLQQRLDRRRTRPSISPAGKRGMVAATLLVAACGLAAWSPGTSGTAAAAGKAGPDCSSGSPTMTVSASGQASATPNVLTIDMGVNVSDATASAALSDANGQATTLTNTLKVLGVTAADIQSTNFSISPNVAQNGAITGYAVSNDLVVTLLVSKTGHDLADAGQVIDAAAASVGDAIRIDGLSFSVSNTRDVDGQARSHAVASAAANAHAMATAAGESIVGVCSINDSTTQTVSPTSFGVAAGTADNQAVVPLEAGTQQATAQVRVVYAITHT